MRIGDGIWVDQQGSANCAPDRPQFHEPVGPVLQQYGRAPASPKPRWGKGKKALVVALICIGLVVVVVVGLGVIGLIVGPQSSTSASSSGGTSSAPPPSTSVYKAPPGGPIPCDPEAPEGPFCFDNKIVTPDGMEKYLASIKGWKCYKHGDTSAPISVDVDGSIGLCAGDGRDPKAGKFRWSQEIDWSNLRLNPKLPLDTIRLSGTVSMIPSKGEVASADGAYAMTDYAMQNTMLAAFPNQKSIADSLYQAYRKSCGANSPDLFNKPFITSVGYEMLCGGAQDPITTTTDKGDPATVFTATVTISGTLQSPDKPLPEIPPATS